MNDESEAEPGDAKDRLAREIGQRLGPFLRYVADQAAMIAKVGRVPEIQPIRTIPDNAFVRPDPELLRTLVKYAEAEEAERRVESRKATAILILQGAGILLALILVVLALI
jgi:hypothetical protein